MGIRLSKTTLPTPPLNCLCVPIVFVAKKGGLVTLTQLMMNFIF